MQQHLIRTFLLRAFSSQAFPLQAFLGLSLSAALLANPVLAAETAHGDAAAGKAASATCAACHGVDGNSAVPSFPKLAQQQPGYITKQLADFKSDARVDATMKGMVAALSEQNMKDLDAYYSSQTSTTAELNAANEADALAGSELFRSGMAEPAITACMACHGPEAKGVQPMFPRLAGQHATYIETQLKAFKSGTRKDPMMSPIAAPLTDEQIKQLAIYVSSLK